MHSITSRLLELNKLIEPETLLPALCPEATDLVSTDPYAFCLASCLDRGMKTEIIWTIPYWIKQDLGHLDPFRMAAMSLEELAALVSRLPQRPRYRNAAPRTIQEISALVANEYGGHAERIWATASASAVQRTFDDIYGVGPGIASMVLQLIEKGYGRTFSDEDHRRMDIKPDVHTRRVLYRLGVAPAEEDYAAIAAARLLHPEYPGEIDGALWHVGRTWCHPSAPDCTACHVKGVCPGAL